MKKLKIILIIIALILLISVIDSSEEKNPRNQQYPDTSTIPSSPKPYDIKTCLYYYGDELTDLNNGKAYKMASGYDLLILTETDSKPEIINKLRKINPNAKIIVYTNATQLVNTHNKIIKENNIYPSMQKIFEMAEKENKNWFLLDKQNNFTYAAHPYLESEYYKEFIPYLDMWVFMDPSSGWANYYANYSKNMIGNLYDGIYSDVAVNYEELTETINTKEWKHQLSENEWDNAMVKMLSNVNNAIGKDKLTIHNNGYNYWISSNAYDGRLLEWWMQLDMKEPVDENLWKLYMDSAEETINSKGILCAAHYGTTAEHRMFGLTSFLLIANDESYYFFDEGGVDAESKLAWYSEYEAKIGTPLNNYYKKDNTYQRDFSKGKILVNPGEENIDIKFDKGYKTLAGEITNEITLKSKTGIMLLK
ncbi:hypothetical protein KAS79_02615 [Candidatus Parcubacteria bacterium]|nr:hypothetical protein [Candidatus Parcubacteria bacterium]